MICLSVQTKAKRAHCCVKPRQLTIAQGRSYCHSLISAQWQQMELLSMAENKYQQTKCYNSVFDLGNYTLTLYFVTNNLQAVFYSRKQEHTAKLARSMSDAGLMKAFCGLVD